MRVQRVIVFLQDLLQMRHVGLGRALLIVGHEVFEGGELPATIEIAGLVGQKSSMTPPGLTTRFHSFTARIGFATCSRQWLEIRKS